MDGRVCRGFYASTQGSSQYLCVRRNALASADTQPAFLGSCGSLNKLKGLRFVLPLDPPQRHWLADCYFLRLLSFTRHPRGPSARASRMSYTIFLFRDNNMGHTLTMPEKVTPPNQDAPNSGASKSACRKRDTKVQGRQVWAEVSASALAYNLRAIRDHVNPQQEQRKTPRLVLSIVKGNGYGTADRK